MEDVQGGGGPGEERKKTTADPVKMHQAVESEKDAVPSQSSLLT